MEHAENCSVLGCFLFSLQKELNQLINTSQVNVAAEILRSIKLSQRRRENCFLIIYVGTLLFF